MMQFIQCLFSPRLYKVYRKDSRDVLYEPSTVEMLGDKVISSANVIFKLGYYSSPLMCIYLYKRGSFLFDDDQAVAGMMCLAGILMLSILMRGVGRVRNPLYLEFLNALNKPKLDMNAYLREIRNYDFDFSSWPMSYSVPPQRSLPTPSARGPLRGAATRALAWLAVHTFGLRMIYPGSISLFHNLMHNALITGRTELVEEFDGQRAKIRTADGNTIDTMFVDNRRNGRHGRYLVVCCEGNMGFYELGLMTIPAKYGCSALGWNHPGFVTSTGKPYPPQEQNAIDAVLQYAINELRFEAASIVMFGWSIGGYSAAWAARTYPDLGGVILDATFADILPLALKQMPRSWESLVVEVVRSHVNLDLAPLLLEYDGPVCIIRRTEDEIISLVDGQVSTNCGNELVSRVVAARHPEVHRLLAEPLKALLRCAGRERDAVARSIGPVSAQPALRLLNKYLRDVRATHCAPLPIGEFEAALRRVTNPTDFN